MAYLELNVEQVNQAAESLPYHAQDMDPLASVVDPRLDMRSAKSTSATSGSSFLAESEQSRRSSVASSVGSMGRARVPPGPPPPPTVAAASLTSDTGAGPPRLDDPVYPDISPRVAEYVATEHPELCSQLAQSIEEHSRVHWSSQHRAGAHPVAASSRSSATTAVVPPSPLKCMAQAADALAVRQSTIGIPRKPTPPTEAIYQELVEYPPESIVTSVDERASWLRTVLNSSPATSNHQGSPAPTNGPSKPPTFLPRSPATISRREIPSVHYWRRPPPSEDQAFDADNLDSASVCSETESNLSWVSDVDDEIRLLKSMMVPRLSQLTVVAEKAAAATQTDPVSVTTGTPVMHVGVETDDLDLFTLLKEKAHLEGELETLQGELGRLVDAKSEFKTRAAAAEARCQKLAEEKEAAALRESNLAQELQTLKMESVRYGRVVGDYDSLIHSKESEAGFLHDEASVLATENRELKVALEELKVDLESRCGAIEGLKRKIAEMHVEGQSAVRARAQMEAERATLLNELQVLEKSKEWFREQLHESQQGRNQLHKEHVTVQAERIALESAAEALRAENARLQQELTESRQRSVRDKESLMKRLEEIEADLLEREAALSREATEAAAAVSAQQSQRAAPSESSGDLSVKLRVAELEEQLRAAESTLSERLSALSALERERSELVSEVQRLRLRLSDSELGRRNQDELLREETQKTRRLQAELAASEERATELRGAQAALEVALAAANEDKRVVGESLGALTENLARLEGNFKMIRTEQAAKAAQVEQLEREKASLSERLSEAEESLSRARQEFESQSSSRFQAQSLELNQLRKQCADLQGVVRVLEADLKKAVADAREAAARHKADKEALRQAESQLERVESDAETLSQRNAVLQSQLQDSQQRLLREETRWAASLQEAVQGASPRMHDQSTWETRVRELEQTLATRDMAAREQERMHKSNIRLLTRKLREKMKELKLAHLQLASATEALQNGHASSGRDAASKEEPERVCAEVQTEDGSTEEEDERVEEVQRLQLQLEKLQGKLAGSVRAQEELGACVEQLERRLAEQGAQAAQLQCQLEQVQERAQRAGELHESTVADLQRELEKERTLSKELRQRIFEEKRKGGQLQRQLASLKQGLSEASQSADARRVEAQAQAERAQALEAQLADVRAKLEGLRGDLATSQAVRHQLEAQLRNAHERDPALEQQMKLLSWNVKEKTQEVSALKEQAQLVENTHATEVSGLRRQLEESQQQLSGLSAELMAVRKEKFTLQARVQELKNVVRSRMAQCKELQRQLTELAETTEFALPNATPEYDDSYITELLQQCSVQPTSRPLGSLQVCLDSLKQDLNTLQSQIRQNVEMPKTELAT
ncbi:uncharacterized protein LOC144146794 [Haemaphysalis longicornis]